MANTDGLVNAVVSDGSALYAGGVFSTVNDATRRRLVRLDAVTGAVDPWDPSLDVAAQSIILSPDKTTLYVAGDFGLVGGTARQKPATAWFDSQGKLLL